MIRFLPPLVAFLLLPFLLAGARAQGAKQAEREPWSFGVNGYYGALFRYRAGLDALNFTNPTAVEVYANRHTTGRRPWEAKYNYPQIGLALAYYNYGVPQELGEAFSLTTYLDNVLLQGRRNSLRFDVGTGLVYSTRHYTPITNEANKAIGSAVTFALRTTLRYEFLAREHLYMNLNLAFRHFSNGGLNKPNNGMNFPMLGVGLRYQHREPQPVQKPAGEMAAPDGRVHLNLRVGAGVKEVLRIDEKHPVYNVSIYGSKQLTRTNTLLLGADGFYDTAMREEFINALLPVPDGELEARMAGVTVGHELRLNRLAVVFQLGRYVYQPLHLFPEFYQRYGLQYSLTKHLSASVMLLAHKRTANVIEWGTAWQL